MKLGLLTYAKVANFGANLQALSTVGYLRAHGHSVMLLDWAADDFHATFQRFDTSQARAHETFVERNIPHTHRCRTDADLAQAIQQEGIEGVIVGSDAVLQHFNTLSRFHCPTSTLWRMDPMTADRVFPNPFWGSFQQYLPQPVPMALMSASCQNTKYQNFYPLERRAMRQALERFCYLSVRDHWTRQMVSSLSHGAMTPPITPDPVFAFNANVGLPPFERSRWQLPERYALVSFKSTDSVPPQWLAQLQKALEEQELRPVALPMPNGVPFRHSFAHEIPTPLDPADWYALIANAAAYVGENMHPIVVSLANGVPCYSLDAYGVRWARVFVDRRSSKVYDILGRFGLTDYYSPLRHLPEPQHIARRLAEFPRQQCRDTAAELLAEYQHMMETLLQCLASGSSH